MYAVSCKTSINIVPLHNATEFESDSFFHRIAFYRLSDGYPFKQEKNDSLLEVIKH